jgi:hypothetical protein
MDNISVKAHSLFLLIKKQWFPIFAVGVYILFTTSYIGPGLYNCTDSTSGIGDNTAGPIWKNSLKPDQSILGNSENSTNYPTGESLYSPVGYVSLVQSTFMWSISKVTNPVCAYNLYNIISYVLTAVVMFAFVFYLTRNRWIALLGGYAVAFTPYVQSKIGGHPSYGYAALLIAILWSALHLITYRKKVHAVMLGALLAICAYFDPYFILFAITITVPVLLTWLIVGLRKTRAKISINRHQLRKRMMPFALSILVFILLMTPLIAVRIINANSIESSVSGVRGNVRAAAMMCSNKPIDYILPDPENIYLKKIFGSDYTTKNTELRNWCGNGESRVSISILALTVVTAGGVILAWERLNKRRLRLGMFLPYEPGLIIGAVTGVGIFAFLLGLPPSLLGIVTPSGLVLDITEMWRIFAREYLLVNMAVIILFTIVLKYFSINPILRSKRIILGVIFAVLFVGITMEYQINKPFNPPRFSYSNDTPQTYKDIRNDADINALAEYPIDRTGLEHDSIVYYLSMQVAHGKKLFNSTVATGQDAKTQSSMKDLQDPQTLQALRAWGIKYVVIHGMKVEDITRELPGVQIMYHSSPRQFALTVVRSDTDNDIALVKILDGPSAQNIVTIEDGYNLNLEFIQSPIGMVYSVSPNTTLRIVPIQKNKTVSSKACFDLKLADSLEPAIVSIKLNGKEVQSINTTNAYTPIQLDVHSNDKITVSNSVQKNMLINNLGCAS